MCRCDERLKGKTEGSTRLAFIPCNFGSVRHSTIAHFPARVQCTGQVAFQRSRETKRNNTFFYILSTILCRNLDLHVVIHTCVRHIRLKWASRHQRQKETRPLLIRHVYTAVVFVMVVLSFSSSSPSPASIPMAVPSPARIQMGFVMVTARL